MQLTHSLTGVWFQPLSDTANKQSVILVSTLCFQIQLVPLQPGQPSTGVNVRNMLGKTAISILWVVLVDASKGFLGLIMFFITSFLFFDGGGLSLAHIRPRVKDFISAVLNVNTV
jgi:hypothetical protein